MPTSTNYIREASVCDAAAIARVHIESSEDAYAPLAKEWSGPDLDGRTRAWNGWLTAAQSDLGRVDLVAVAGSEVVGFVTVGLARRHDVTAKLEVYVMHVLPDHRGKGVGGRLWKEGCTRSRGENLRSVYVETFAELRCCSFYEARGGEPVLSTPASFKGGSVTRVVYLWRTGKLSG